MCWARLQPPQYLLGAEIHTFIHGHVGHGLAGGQGDGDVVWPAETAPKHRAAIWGGTGGEMVGVQLVSVALIGLFASLPLGGVWRGKMTTNAQP